MTDNSAALWSFACQFYAQGHNAQRLIQLQDQQGININEVLYVLWLKSQGISPTPQHIRNQQARCALIKKRIIQRRQQRRLHKGKLGYAWLKRQELKLEKQHLHLLSLAAPN